ncbi:MAG: hypothetical protein LBP55_04330 [Candidatus Adiutrix sp.]|nr:hypothetical protein [Candidatus Adiutrix sp.]
MRETNIATDRQPNKPAPLEADRDDYHLPDPPVPICTPEEYDAWYRLKVQEALDDDSGITYTTDEVRASTQAIIDRNRWAKDIRDRSCS